jgi:signal transduction histidine kinase
VRWQNNPAKQTKEKQGLSVVAEVVKTSAFSNGWTSMRALFDRLVLSRVGLPVLGLIALIGVSGFWLLGDIARDQDATNVSTTQRFVEQAVQSEVEANTSISTEYSLWDDAYVNITLKNDMDWAETNFFSINSSAIFVIRPDADANDVMRFAYVDPKVEASRKALEAFALTLPVVRKEKSRSVASKAYSKVFANGLVRINGKLAAMAVQPLKPSPENHNELFVPTHALDYVIVITFVNPSFVETTERTFGLKSLDLSVFAENSATLPALDSSKIAFDLRDMNDVVVGRLAWANSQPGSSAFSSRIGPIVAMLLIVGILTILVTQQIVSSQTRLIELARQAAEDGSKAKSSFLANVSHELRTPLNAIIGFAEIIDEDATYAGNETTSKDARKVANSAQHLLGLINDLLDHSKIEAGKMDMAPILTPLHPLITGVGEVLESHVAKNNSQLIVRCDPLIGDAIIDGMRLKQCLLNLVSNAAKFTKDGSVTVSARPVDREGTPFIRITVKDTGIGMSAATLAKLFTPFVQANESTAKNYGGTGLGLVITRRLCEAMGGSVSVESVEGQGSTFTMLVPRGMAWNKDGSTSELSKGLAA